MNKLFFCIASFFCFAFCVHAQELLPFVENFTKSDYNGDNQVWNVCQGNDHALYYANNHDFLRYNGVKWEKYTLPNKTIIRSVFADNDKIYCGSYNEFGYWKRLKGTMVYVSLSKNKQLFVGLSNNEEIWKIFKFQGKIYFQSFNEIFIYEHGNVKKIRIPFQISYCFPIQNRLYVASVSNGVFIFEGNQFKKITAWKALEGTVIHAIDRSQGNLYVFTKKNGVFVDRNGVLVPWANPLNTHLKSELIITAKFIDSSRLAIGTAFKGLYVIDLHKNTVINVNRNNALKNNSVLSIGIDSENDLWLGMDNGISHVEINAPVAIFSDNTGVLGSVYAIAKTPNGYLLGSNHGLFKYESNTLSFIENSQGQVWEINKIGNQYLIGHNDGTFIYDTTSFRKVNDCNGGWRLMKSDFNSDYFQAHYAGIIRYQGTDFSKFKTINGLTKPIKNIAQNKPDELWAVDNYKSLYKINFNNNQEVFKVVNITQSNGISNDYEVKMIKYKNEILFLIYNTWYRYNPITDKLEADAVFNKQFKNITQIIPIDNDGFVVLKDGLLYLVNQKNNVFSTELIPEKYYKGRIINQDTKVYRFEDKLLINLDDGFFMYKPHKIKGLPKSVVVEGYCNNRLIAQDAKIKYNQTLHLNIISPFFGYNKHTLFYKLNTNSLIPVTNGSITLTNLNSGNHLVQLFYHDGNQYKEVANYKFSVRYPWYFSFWMILLYLLIVSGTFFLYYRWNFIKYQQKIKLKEEELKHQREILQLELDAQNKLKIQEYEKHILEIQVQTKASEVAGKSLSIAKQTEMIEGIQNLLEKENDISNLKNNIRKTIKLNSINKKEWETFENNLFKSHEDFINRLINRYPKLSSKDKKLCIYLKMNLTSKEIAPLMNISYRGVELHRYRLRKKLSLDQETNLSAFMNLV